MTIVEGRYHQVRRMFSAVGNQVRGLISGRKINAEQGISAIMAVIARRSGGRLGGTLDTQSRGAEAAMNRLRNSWLLLQSNFARSPAFARIIGFIDFHVQSGAVGGEEFSHFTTQRAQALIVVVEASRAPDQCPLGEHPNGSTSSEHACRGHPAAGDAHCRSQIHRGHCR